MDDDNSIIASLDEIYFRFALTEDDKFEETIHRVLPRLLVYSDSTSKSVRAKLLQIHGNLTRRIKLLGTVSLPLYKLLELFQSTQSTGVQSMCLVYIDLGLDIIPYHLRGGIASHLLYNIHTRSKHTQITLLKCILKLIPSRRFLFESGIASITASIVGNLPENQKIELKSHTLEEIQSRLLELLGYDQDTKKDDDIDDTQSSDQTLPLDHQIHDHTSSNGAAIKKKRTKTANTTSGFHTPLETEHEQPISLSSNELLEAIFTQMTRPRSLADVQKSRGGNDSSNAPAALSDLPVLPSVLVMEQYRRLFFASENDISILVAFFVDLFLFDSAHTWAMATHTQSNTLQASQTQTSAPTVGGGASASAAVTPSMPTPAEIQSGLLIPGLSPYKYTVLRNMLTQVTSAMRAADTQYGRSTSQQKMAGTVSSTSHGLSDVMVFYHQTCTHLVDVLAMMTGSFIHSGQSGSSSSSSTMEGRDAQTAMGTIQTPSFSGLLHNALVEHSARHPLIHLALQTPLSVVLTLTGFSLDTQTTHGELEATTTIRINVADSESMTAETGVHPPPKLSDFLSTSSMADIFFLYSMIRNNTLPSVVDGSTHGVNEVSSAGDDSQMGEQSPTTTSTIIPFQLISCTSKFYLTTNLHVDHLLVLIAAAITTTYGWSDTANEVAKSLLSSSTLYNLSTLTALTPDGIAVIYHILLGSRELSPGKIYDAAKPNKPGTECVNADIFHWKLNQPRCAASLVIKPILIDFLTNLHCTALKMKLTEVSDLVKEQNRLENQINASSLESTSSSIVPQPAHTRVANPKPSTASHLIYFPSTTVLLSVVADLILLKIPSAPPINTLGSLGTPSGGSDDRATAGMMSVLPLTKYLKSVLTYLTSILLAFNRLNAPLTSMSSSSSSAVRVQSPSQGGTSIESHRSPVDSQMTDSDGTAAQESSQTLGDIMTTQEQIRLSISTIRETFAPALTVSTCSLMIRTLIRFISMCDQHSSTVHDWIRLQQQLMSQQYQRSGDLTQKSSLYSSTLSDVSFIQLKGEATYVISLLCVTSPECVVTSKQPVFTLMMSILEDDELLYNMQVLEEHLQERRQGGGKQLAISRDPSQKDLVEALFIDLQDYQYLPQCLASRALAKRTNLSRSLHSQTADQTLKQRVINALQNISTVYIASNVKAHTTTIVESIRSFLSSHLPAGEKKLSVYQLPPTSSPSTVSIYNTDELFLTSLQYILFGSPYQQGVGVYYLTHCYPYQHPFARVICALLTTDAQGSIKEEATRGIDITIQRSVHATTVVPMDGIQQVAEAQSTQGDESAVGDGGIDDGDDMNISSPKQRTDARVQLLFPPTFRFGLGTAFRYPLAPQFADLVTLMSTFFDYGRDGTADSSAADGGIHTSSLENTGKQYPERYAMFSIWQALATRARQITAESDAGIAPPKWKLPLSRLSPVVLGNLLTIITQSLLHTARSVYTKDRSMTDAAASSAVANHSKTQPPSPGLGTPANASDGPLSSLLASPALSRVYVNNMFHTEDNSHLLALQYYCQHYLMSSTTSENPQAGIDPSLASYLQLLAELMNASLTTPLLSIQDDRTPAGHAISSVDVKRVTVFCRSPALLLQSLRALLSLLQVSPRLAQHLIQRSNIFPVLNRLAILSSPVQMAVVGAILSLVSPWVSTADIVSTLVQNLHALITTDLKQYHGVTGSTMYAWTSKLTAHPNQQQFTEQPDGDETKTTALGVSYLDSLAPMASIIPSIKAHVSNQHNTNDESDDEDRWEQQNYMGSTAPQSTTLSTPTNTTNVHARLMLNGIYAAQLYLRDNAIACDGIQRSGRNHTSLLFDDGDVALDSTDKLVVGMNDDIDGKEDVVHHSITTQAVDTPAVQHPLSSSSASTSLVISDLVQACLQITHWYFFYPFLSTMAWAKANPQRPDAHSYTTFTKSHNEWTDVVNGATTAIKHMLGVIPLSIVLSVLNGAASQHHSDQSPPPQAMYASPVNVQLYTKCILTYVRLMHEKDDKNNESLQSSSQQQQQQQSGTGGSQLNRIGAAASPLAFRLIDLFSYLATSQITYHQSVMKHSMRAIPPYSRFVPELQSFYLQQLQGLSILFFHDTQIYIGRSCSQILLGSAETVSLDWLSDSGASVEQIPVEYISYANDSGSVPPTNLGTKQHPLRLVTSVVAPVRVKSWHPDEIDVLAPPHIYHPVLQTHSHHMEETQPSGSQDQSLTTLIQPISFTYQPKHPLHFDVFDTFLRKVAARTQGGSNAVRNAAVLWFLTILTHTAQSPLFTEYHVIETLIQQQQNQRGYVLPRHYQQQLDLLLFIQQSLLSLLGDPNVFIREVVSLSLATLFYITHQVTSPASMIDIGDEDSSQSITHTDSQMVNTQQPTIRSALSRDIMLASMLRTLSVHGQESSGNAEGFNALLSLLNEIGVADAPAPLSASSVHSSTTFASFRDLASVASELGSPSLIYSLLAMTVVDEIWNLSILQTYRHSYLNQHRTCSGGSHCTCDQLSPKLLALLPRILRHRHDPQTVVRTSMQSLCTLIVPHLPVMYRRYSPALLKSFVHTLQSPNARTRLTSTLALTDLLIVVPESSLAPGLFLWVNEFWAHLLLTLQDIMDNVRLSALTLSQHLVKHTTYLIQHLPSLAAMPQHSRIRDNMVITIESLLTLITTKGVPSTIPTVHKVSLTLLSSLAQHAQQQIIPSIPRILPMLIEAMSSREPEAMGYLRLHAAAGALGDITAAAAGAQGDQTLLAALGQAMNAMNIPNTPQQQQPSLPPGFGASGTNPMAQIDAMRMRANSESLLFGTIRTLLQNITADIVSPTIESMINVLMNGSLIAVHGAVFIITGILDRVQSVGHLDPRFTEIVRGLYPNIIGALFYAAHRSSVPMQVVIANALAQCFYLVRYRYQVQIINTIYTACGFPIPAKMYPYRSMLPQSDRELHDILQKSKGSASDPLPAIESENQAHDHPQQQQQQQEPPTKQPAWITASFSTMLPYDGLSSGVVAMRIALALVHARNKAANQHSQKHPHSSSHKRGGTLSGISAPASSHEDATHLISTMVSPLCFLLSHLREDGVVRPFAGVVTLPHLVKSPLTMIHGVLQPTPSQPSTFPLQQNQDGPSPLLIRNILSHGEPYSTDGYMDVISSLVPASSMSGSRNNSNHAGHGSNFSSSSLSSTQSQTTTGSSHSSNAGDNRNQSTIARTGEPNDVISIISEEICEDMTTGIPSLFKQSLPEVYSLVLYSVQEHPTHLVQRSGVRSVESMFLLLPSVLRAGTSLPDLTGIPAVRKALVGSSSSTATAIPRSEQINPFLPLVSLLEHTLANKNTQTHASKMKEEAVQALVAVAHTLYLLRKMDPPEKQPKHALRDQAMGDDDSDNGTPIASASSLGTLLDRISQRLGTVITSSAEQPLVLTRTLWAVTQMVHMNGEQDKCTSPPVDKGIASLDAMLRSRMTPQGLPQKAQPESATDTTLPSLLSQTQITHDIFPALLKLFYKLTSPAINHGLVQQHARGVFTSSPDLDDATIEDSTSKTTLGNTQKSIGIVLEFVIESMSVAMARLPPLEIQAVMALLNDTELVPRVSSSALSSSVPTHTTLLVTLLFTCIEGITKYTSAGIVSALLAFIATLLQHLSLTPPQFQATMSNHHFQQQMKSIVKSLLADSKRKRLRRDAISLVSWILFLSLQTNTNSTWIEQEISPQLQSLFNTLTAPTSDMTDAQYDLGNSALIAKIKWVLQHMEMSSKQKTKHNPAVGIDMRSSDI